MHPVTSSHRSSHGRDLRGFSLAVLLGATVPLAALISLYFHALAVAVIVTSVAGTDASPAATMAGLLLFLGAVAASLWTAVAIARSRRGRARRVGFALIPLGTPGVVFWIVASALAHRSATAPSRRI
jgi:hypothetical protein